MQFIFGWADSAIEHWVSTTIGVIGDAFAQFRSFPSVQEQMMMALEHAQFCASQGADVLRMYGVRLNWGLLADAVHRVFQGAFAAMDGTFTLCCRFPEDIQELMSVCCPFI